MAKQFATNPKAAGGKKSKKGVAPATISLVDSPQAPAISPATVALEATAMEPPADSPSAKEGATNVTLNLKGLDKRQRNAIYTGSAVSIRIPVGAFPDKTALPTLEVSGLAGPKEKLTAEQRKEARKNAPKPTLAERVAAAEKRAAALRAKLAEQPAAI